MPHWRWFVAIACAVLVISAVGLARALAERLPCRSCVVTAAADDPLLLLRYGLPSREATEGRER